MTTEGVKIPEEQKADGMELLSTVFDEIGDLLGFEGDQDFTSILNGTFNFAMIGEMLGPMVEMLGPLMDNLTNSISAVAEPLMAATNEVPDVAPKPGVAPDVAPEVVAQNNVNLPTPGMGGGTSSG